MLSDLARRSLSAIVSASSVRLMRDCSEGSDLDIFLVPSRKRHHARGLAQDHRLGQREQLDGEAAVERAGDVAGELQMLLLVLADRHVGRLVDQDVGRHQHRVGEQADRRVLAVLAGLLLELGHPVEPAHLADAAQHPGELGVRRDVALHEQDRALRVDAGGEQGGGRLAGVAAQLVGVLQRGQGVLVDQAVEAVIGRLQPHPMPDRAQIVAQVDAGGRLDAGKDAALHGSALVVAGSAL